ncbi:MAG TPA: AraC family transcriptional regulator [Casimicrobiaceae bacterium]|nr:AraC family transcriptional regulator [Casimicrobiaceae bacterium]
MSVGETSVPASVFGAEEELWRQRVGALTVAPALLRQLGTDPAPVLTAVGLDASALEFSENTIPYASFGRLMHEGAQRSGCDYFGLLVGQAWHLSNMGLVGELIRHSSTVGAGLRLGVVYHHLNSQGGVVFLREQGAVAEYGYAIYHRGVQGAHEIYDGVLAALINYMRELCGPNWVPSEVLVAHAPPSDASPYRRLFRCPVRFNSELSALRFAAHWLKRPVAGADPRTLRDLEKQASSLAQPDLIEKLRRSLRVLLLSGVTSGDALADLLTMHRRTLNRRLKEHGTTFREVLEDVRFEAARQLLSATQLALDDIAAALAYAGVSPFTRAFRRRSGTTPGQWRDAAKATRPDQVEMRSRSASIRTSAD